MQIPSLEFRVISFSNAASPAAFFLPIGADIGSSATAPCVACMDAGKGREQEAEALPAVYNAHKRPASTLAGVRDNMSHSLIYHLMLI